MRKMMLRWTGLDASKINSRKPVDDMESQGNEVFGDRAKISEEETGKVETNYINGSHQSELEKEPAAHGRSERGKHNENFDSCDNINEVSTNSDHGLDSIVQDSQSPVVEDCVESVQKNTQAQNAEFYLDGNQDQEKGRAKRPFEGVANIERLISTAAGFD
ncbi:hypothetical protein RHGRI_015539 [Rhododendron griersonianum]|uniref:Uncharacterized protein n=1 Tax=Rhododendron griersonianum TaxID=479676 RepID=A0AAV6KDQ8_9ERIC|nr:hypothetical protein RHGRI_015539 [Rhododendron griersonianum]